MIVSIDFIRERACEACICAAARARREGGGSVDEDGTRRYSVLHSINRGDSGTSSATHNGGRAANQAKSKLEVEFTRNC